MKVDEAATEAARKRHAYGVAALNAFFTGTVGGFSGRRPSSMTRAGLLAYRRARDKGQGGYLANDRGFVGRRRARKAARAARKRSRRS